MLSSALTGYVPGLPLSSGVVRDTVNQSSRYYAINHSLLHLYALALGTHFPLLANRRILEVPDATGLVFRSQQGYYTDWLKKYTYTYETTYPAGTPIEEVMERLKTTLDENFRYRGVVEEREVSCLVLKAPEGVKTAPSGEPKRIHKEEGRYTQMQAVTTADLVYILNQLEDAPPMINAAETLPAFDLDLSSRPITFAEWQPILRQKGFALERQQRRLPMFVLTAKSRSDQARNPAVFKSTKPIPNP